MSLRLYDTRARAVRPLEPLQAGTVGIYVCGPTVQARPHVGHLRSAVALDVLHRWLLERGQRVVLVATSPTSTTRSSTTRATTTSRGGRWPPA
jgi:cysteinyl-tRNA synthetase